ADLANVALVLVNGNATPPAEYFFNGSTTDATKRIRLTQALVPGNSLPPNGMVVVAPAALTSPVPPGVFSITVVPGSGGWIQNGGSATASSDGIALFDLAANLIIDGLAYEGPVNGATLVGITGTFDLTEGTSTTAAPQDPGTANQSLVRRGPNARDTQD